MVSIIASYIGVKLISLIPSIGFRDFNMSAWKWLLLAGFLGSIFNGLGHGLLQNEFSLSTQILGYMPMTAGLPMTAIAALFRCMVML